MGNIVIICCYIYLYDTLVATLLCSMKSAARLVVMWIYIDEQENYLNEK